METATAALSALLAADPNTPEGQQVIESTTENLKAVLASGVSQLMSSIRPAGSESTEEGESNSDADSETRGSTQSTEPPKTSNLLATNTMRLLSTVGEAVTAMTTRSATIGRSTAEFAEVRLGSIPQTPQVMTREQVIRVTVMVMDELRELLQTACIEGETPQTLLKDCANRSCARKELAPLSDTSQLDVITHQADALTDVLYYVGDAAGGAGINLDKCLTEVHAANMNKRFPDGEFHFETIDVGNGQTQRKVIKPPGWTEPDMHKTVLDMITHGSWC